MRRHFLILPCCCLLLIGFMVGSLYAALTTEQKKELKEIQGEVTKISPLITKKKLADAASAIEAAEERVAKFIDSSKLKETDSALKPVQNQLEKVKSQLAKASGKGGTSFAKSVAPIFVAKCVSCHGEDGKGGLNLDTFEGLEKGGKSGFLCEPGNPEGSLLISRLIVENEQLRMPKGKDPLSEKEIQTIATWIAEGAKFDGDKSSSMAALVKSAASGKSKGTPRKAEIVKATGNETVRFMDDLMPEFMDTCGRCHNDTVKRSGFSVMSFEKLMKGGDSGAVIVAGKPEESRLWRLVNGDETPVMPAGNQTGVTRKWYNNLKTWIQEGAKFDGDDPKKNFPTLEDREKSAMNKFTPEQWVERRKKSSDADWKKTFPNAVATRRETSEFLFYGDVSDDRLAQVEKWATEHLASLRQTFKAKDEPLWRGKLAVFVFKERFGYEEFNNSVYRREVDREVFGNSQVNANMSEAQIALQDVGDSTSESSPGMQLNVIEHLTGAFLKRTGSNLPEWVIRGTGLAMAHRKSPGNAYLTVMPRAASVILQESKLTEPEKVFASGTFGPGEVGPVGFTLVEYLVKRYEFAKFGQFVQRLQSGATPEAAAAVAFEADARQLAVMYAESLPMGSRKNKK